MISIAFISYMFSYPVPTEQNVLGYINTDPITLQVSKFFFAFLIVPRHMHHPLNFLTLAFSCGVESCSRFPPKPTTAVKNALYSLFVT